MKFAVCIYLERLVGFEPTYLTWQASTLTRLCYSRINDGFFLPVPPTKTVELGRMFYL